MPGARVHFDDGEWQKFFLKHRDKDWASILKAAYATVGHKNIDKHFRDEKGPEGSWAPRKDSTQHRYAKIFAGEWKVPAGSSRSEFSPSNKLLQKTGRLKGSILPTNTTKVSRTAIRAFSNVDYSGIHNTGGRVKVFGKYTAVLPKREFMWLDDKAREDMLISIMGTAFKD